MGMADVEGLVKAGDVTVGERISIPNFFTLDPESILVVEDPDSIVLGHIEAREKPNVLVLAKKNTPVKLYPTVITP